MKRETGGGVSNMAVGVALNDALDSSDEVDPSARALMEKQVRMLDLQMHNLREENREQKVKFLRERLHAGFELIIAGVMLAGLITIGGMVWSASQADGLVIEPFAAPADMAEKGLTGAVLANRLSDGLGDIESVTNSVRAGGAIRTTQRQEVKVQIPKTGLSISDAQALLHAWLGNETSVTGDLVHDGDRVALTVRVGDRPGVTLYGAESELDVLIHRAAEQVLARTEPYRYAVYLTTQNKAPQALAVAESLAASGTPTDRAWGYAVWSRMLASGGDFVGASAKARRAIALDPNIAAAHDNLAAAQRLLGHDDQALRASRAALSVLRRQRGEMDKVSGPSRLATAEGRVLEAEADFGAAAGRYTEAVRIGGLARAAQASASLPRALAMNHDIAGARRALDDLSGQLSEDALTDAALAPAMVAIQAEDWAEAERLLKKADAMALMFGQAGATVRTTQIAPYLAYVQAMTGQLDAARASIATAPAACYACARVRAVIAGKAGDRAGSEALFKAAVALGPTLPAAYLDWARMRLAAGDLDGAIVQAQKAAEVAPKWSDPQVVWGEALAKKGDARAAVVRFQKAAVLSPRWGLPNLRRAQLLLRQGKREEGRLLLQTAGRLELSVAQRAEQVAALR
jgi:tetratricopeptide (TPR) repeat protein